MNGAAALKCQLRFYITEEYKMLKIFFGDNLGANYIFNPDVFFNNTYEDEWITSETSRKMIKDIDGSEVKASCMIDSPFLL